jgi:prepilin-type N-terminal cleavage/methylation domain-containing protein
MNQKGITLLEVVVTAVLIGLLASIATLGINQYLTNGNKRIAASDINTLAAATSLYLLDHYGAGQYPDDVTGLDQTLVSLSYLPEYPVDPFATSSADDRYLFALTTYNGNTAIRIYSRGPTDSPVERFVQH